MSRARGLLVAGVLTCVLSPTTASAANSTLSSRLQILATPELQNASDARQADAVSLLAHGPGSLARLGEQLVAEVRVTGDPRSRANGLAEAGARILHISTRYDTVTIAVDEDDLGDVAGVGGVDYVEEVLTPMSGAAEKVAASDPDDVGSGPSAGGSINTCATGTVSEANTQLKAAIAKTQFDVDGSGVTVGILSDSFNFNGTAATHAPGDIKTGDLPGTGNPCGRATPVNVVAEGASGADEGRAMLQAVHDVAPGANLAFASASLSPSSFADNIQALRNAGADVIADDWLFFREPPYQDGIVATAINDVVADGAVYESMAYNSNRIISGQNVNSLSAPAYRSTACPVAVGGTDCMDFDPGAGTDATFSVPVVVGSKLNVVLNWAEPQFGVGDDFNLYMLGNAGDTISLKSEDVNANSGAANEFIGATIGSAGVRQFVIKRVSGTGTPPISLTNLDNVATSYTGVPEWNATNSTDTFGPTIIGHNGAGSAITVGAVPYNNSSTVEAFSARGPVTHYFQPINGTTPAAAFPSPQVLSKPDITATDGGANTFFGVFQSPVFRFFGSSQSAPHAAGVAALQLEANPNVTPAQVKANQKASAIAVGSFGANDVGSGLLQATTAVAASPPPSPQVNVNSLPLTKEKTPTFTFTKTGDLKTLTCKVDAKAAAACSSPFTTPSLSDGQHTLTVTATDYFSHSGSDDATVSVDATKPKVKFKKKPAKKGTSKSAKFEISTESGADLRCKLDSKAAKSCGSKPSFHVGTGSHKLSVTAADKAGNKGSGSYSWTVKKKKRK